MLSGFIAWLTAMGIQPTHLIAGLFGGLISALVEEGSFWEKMAIGFAGGLSAAYLTPLVFAFLFITASPAIMNAAAFCLGLFGMSLCKGLIGIGKIYARNPGKLKDDIFAFILKFASKNDDK